MLHPFMPFITEELWHALGPRDEDLIIAKWPDPNANISKSASDAINWVIELTTNVRSAKNELGIPPGQKLAAYLPQPSDLATGTIERSSAAIERLARLTPIQVGASPSGPTIQVKTGSDVFVIPLDGIIDIDAEKSRLMKALQSSEKEKTALENRVSNPNFLQRAKPEAVEKAKEDYAFHTSEVERLTSALNNLG